MSLILLQPQHQFLDSTGTPYPAGTKVYTYINGTETDKPTYTDSSQSTANDNPIVLTEGARASIWVLTNEDYTFKITTSADVTLETINDISGNTSTFNTLMVQASNLDMNGSSIVTNNNQDLPITPHGTGKLKISRPELQSNLETNGNDIEITSGDNIKGPSGLKNILDLGATASAVNYIKITNSATGSDPVVEAKGTDSDIGITLLVKGASDANAGTYGGAVSINSTAVIADDDDLATRGYVTSVLGTMDYTLDEHEASLFVPTLATDAEVLAGTNNTKPVAVADVIHHKSTGLFSGTVTYSAGTPTLSAQGYATSITDLGVGVWRLNTINVVDNGGTSGWNGDCAFAGSGYPYAAPNATDTIVNVTGITGGASGTISGSCTDGSTGSLADHPFQYMIVGGQRA